MEKQNCTVHSISDLTSIEVWFDNGWYWCEVGCTSQKTGPFAEQWKAEDDAEEWYHLVSQ